MAIKKLLYENEDTTNSIKESVMNILEEYSTNKTSSEYIYNTYLSEKVDNLMKDVCFYGDVNEAHVRVKRKWGDYQEKKAYTKATMRNNILEFLYDEMRTEEELDEFLRTLKESTGKAPTKKWFENNKSYFTKKNGMWTLSERGKKLYKSHTIEEEKQGIYRLDI